MPFELINDDSMSQRSAPCAHEWAIHQRFDALPDAQEAHRQAVQEVRELTLDHIAISSVYPLPRGGYGFTVRIAFGRGHTGPMCNVWEAERGARVMSRIRVPWLYPTIGEMLPGPDRVLDALEHRQAQREAARRETRLLMLLRRALNEALWPAGTEALRDEITKVVEGSA